MTVLHIYKLEDLQQTQPVAKLPNGEHSIGRGGILTCTDKRVSHNHAIINITEDKVILKSVHINPCFYKAAKGNIIVLVKKDESVSLSDGDQFALLADAYWFKIRILSDESSIQTNESSIQTNESSIQTNESSIDSPKKHNQDEECEKTSNVRTTSGSCLPNISKLLNASLEADEAQIDTNKLIINLENIFQEDFGKKHITDGEDSHESTDFADLLTRDTGNVPETEKPGSAVDEDESVAAQIDQSKTEENKAEIAVTSKGSSSEIENDPPEKDLGTVKTQGDDKCNSDTEAANATGASTSVDKPKSRRERCWYGASCYRKNPVHRTALSHPGDDDYESDSSDDRPVCPYGASCYRTNVDHRRVYKHPAPPSVKKPAGDGQPIQPPKKAEESVSGSDNSSEEESEEGSEDTTVKRTKRKAAKKVKKLTETPEDDYDFNDPFLNDGSSDDFEPSEDDSDTTDWEDSQCVDEESHERKRLLSEAKKFTKAKKRRKR